MAQPTIKGTGFTALRIGVPGGGSSVPQQGTALTYCERGTITVTPGAIGGATSVDTSLTIANAVLGDTVILTPPATALTDGLVLGQHWVSATGTVKVRIGNLTAGSLTPASGTWAYVLLRS